MTEYTLEFDTVDELAAKLAALGEVDEVVAHYRDALQLMVEDLQRRGVQMLPGVITMQSLPADVAHTSYVSVKLDSFPQVGVYLNALAGELGKYEMGVAVQQFISVMSEFKAKAEELEAHGVTLTVKTKIRVDLPKFRGSAG